MYGLAFSTGTGAHTAQTMFPNYIFCRTSGPTAVKFYTGQRWLSVTFIICKQQKRPAAAIRVFFQRPRFKRFPHFPTPKEKRDAHAPPTTTTTITTTPSRPRKKENMYVCTGVVGGEKKKLSEALFERRADNAPRPATAQCPPRS